MNCDSRSACVRLNPPTCSPQDSVWVCATLCKWPFEPVRVTFVEKLNVDIVLLPVIIDSIHVYLSLNSQVLEALKCLDLPSSQPLFPASH